MNYWTALKNTRIPVNFLGTPTEILKNIIMGKIPELISPTTKDMHSTRKYTTSEGYK